MESFAHLSEAQRLSLNESAALNGVDQIDQILALGLKVLNARIKSLMYYETSLIGQIDDLVVL